MKLTAIRHTSVDVPAGICYGISDVSVANSFPEESAQIQAQLGNSAFDLVFSSPLKRCTKLASTLFQEDKIVPDDRLRELNFGDWEMQSWDSIFDSSEGRKWFQDYAVAKCPGGESFYNLVSRVELFLEELKEFESDQIAMITHAGVIRAMMCLLQQKTAEEAFNTSLRYGQIVEFLFENQTK